MKDSELAAAGPRAAAAFVVRAWAGLWWALAPCVLAWTVAALPGDEGPHWAPVALLASMAATALLYRLATPGGARPVPGLIARQAAVWALSLAFAVVLGSLLLVVFLAAAYGVASAGHGFSGRDVATWAGAVDSRGRWVLGVVGVVGLIAFGWAMSRTALGSAATAAVGKVQLLSTWPLTRGLGLRLLAARLVIAAPAVWVFALARGAERSSAANAHTGALLMATAAGFYIGGLGLPLHAGLMAYIYSRRAAERPDSTASS